jgi:hypothetical protein
VNNVLQLKKFSKNNALFLIKICALIRLKDITLNLFKVKGHSGLHGNDMVDAAVKNIISTFNFMKNSFTDNLHDFIYFFSTFNSIPIKQNFEKACYDDVLNI